MSKLNRTPAAGDCGSGKAGVDKESGTPSDVAANTKGSANGKDSTHDGSHTRDNTGKTRGRKAGDAPGTQFGKDAVKDVGKTLPLPHHPATAIDRLDQYLRSDLRHERFAQGLPTVQLAETEANNFPHCRPAPAGRL